MNREYAEAAAELNLPVSWLRKHIKALPHQKFGHYVRFNDDDIKAISAMHKVTPKAEGATLHVLREAAQQRNTQRQSRKAA